MRPLRSTPWLQYGAVAAAVFAAAFGLWHGLSLAPDATNRLRDDAFYEFVWAANLAAGRGPMVSDGITTSGVQLAWSLALVPLAWSLGAAALPLVAPWLGFALHVATAFAWWRGTRDRIVGFCVAACWLGNPLLVRESQNGQETALACFVLSLLWLRRRAGEAGFVALAVLAVLARTDALAVVLALSVWRHRADLRRALVAPGIAFVVSSLANRLLGSGWMPDSALPMPWLVHAQHTLAAHGETTLADVWWFLRPVLLGGPWAAASAAGTALLVFAVVRPWWPVALRALPPLAVGAAAASGTADLAAAGWLAMLLAIAPAPAPRRVPRALLAVLLGMGAIVLLHWAIRWYPRDYYAAPLVVAVMAALQRYGRLRVALLVFAVAQVADWQRIVPEPLAGQREMEMAGRFVGEVLDDGERIGCFNSGLVTFHAFVLATHERRHGVVNLDGVVDARSFAALASGRLGEHLDAQGLRFVLDNPVQFLGDPEVPHACGPWFGDGFDAARDLVEIARFDVPGVGGDRPGTESMRLYWRRGRGAEPPQPPTVRDLGPAEDGGRYVLWPGQAGQTLQGEDARGHRIALVSLDVRTTAIVAVPPDALASGRLFVAGVTAPLLTVPKL